jgi:hypothetical protein
MLLRICVISLLAIQLSGCSSFRKASNDMGKFQAEPILRSGPLESLDLLVALNRNKPDRPSSQLGGAEYSLALDDALQRFNGDWGSQAAGQRNLILDRIILASTQSCEKYKGDMLRKQAQANFWLGTLGVTLGAAGAVVAGLQAANNLSAASAITSGVRAEYNQDYFADQAANALTKAIDKRRAQMLGEFAEAKKQTIENYSVRLALADGAQYHGVCSLIGAMQYADHAVSVLDPEKGLKTTAASTFMPKRPEGK